MDKTKMTNAILLAEDNPSDLELTQLALEKCVLPNPVIIARDGEEVMDYLLRRNAHASRPPGNPALILLDLKMPKLDGIEVLKAIRFDPQLASIPVVVLTHSALEADIHRSQILGIDKYIVKPIDLSTFLTNVCNAVKQHIPNDVLDS
jgi:CheY-like chemotaxis protein